MYTKIPIYLRLFKLKAPIPSGVLRINTSIYHVFFSCLFVFTLKGIYSLILLGVNYLMVINKKIIE